MDQGNIIGSSNIWEVDLLNSNCSNLVCTNYWLLQFQSTSCSTYYKLYTTQPYKAFYPHSSHPTSPACAALMSWSCPPPRLKISTSLYTTTTHSRWSMGKSRGMGRITRLEDALRSCLGMGELLLVYCSTGCVVRSCTSFKSWLMANFAVNGR